MGWAHCGEDSKGRMIGYAIEATCDHPGCNKNIDRGVSYACGEMHGESDVMCEGYFCEKHRSYETVEYGGKCLSLCLSCARRAKLHRLLEIAGTIEEEGPVGGLSQQTCKELGEDLYDFATDMPGFYELADACRKLLEEGKGRRWAFSASDEIQEACEGVVRAVERLENPLTKVEP